MAKKTPTVSPWWRSVARNVAGIFLWLAVACVLAWVASIKKTGGWPW